jgi:hypothetical protein
MTSGAGVPHYESAHSAEPVGKDDASPVRVPLHPRCQPVHRGCASLVTPAPSHGSRGREASDACTATVVWPQEPPDTEASIPHFGWASAWDGNTEPVVRGRASPVIRLRVVDVAPGQTPGMGAPTPSLARLARGIRARVTKDGSARAVRGEPPCHGTRARGPRVPSVRATDARHDARRSYGGGARQVSAHVDIRRGEKSRDSPGRP